MRRLDIELDKLVPGSNERIHSKSGSLADVAACISCGLELRDKGAHVHFVCPCCHLDCPGDMIVDMRPVADVPYDWLCTGCLDGLYRRGRKPDGTRYTRREVFELAGATVNGSGDFWDKTAKVKFDKQAR